MSRRFFLFLPILLVIISCGRQTRQVVPYEVDPEEVFRPLEAQDEDSPIGPVFGENSIPGFIFDTDFTTENPDIFVFFQNFTVLDINPAITQTLFEFINNQLTESGFIEPSESFSENEFLNLIESGTPFAQSSAKVLDSLKSEFEARYDTLASYGSPFNIYFQVYPVFLDDNYVTYREYCYSYTGGAHGITASFLKTYDLKTGKELTLADIVKPEGMKEVHEEVAARMAYSYPIYENITTVDQYIDSLNVWLGDFNGDDESQQDNHITLENYPLPDPGITKEGLAFIYQMYSMAPGSDGCPLVVVPYKDIKGCVYPQFKN